MFVRRDFREKKKFRREKLSERNLGGRVENFVVGHEYFLSEPTKKISPKNWEKTEKRKLSYLMDENVHVHLYMGFVHINNFFLFFFFLVALFASFFFLRPLAHKQFFLLKKCITFLFYLMRT